MENNQILLNTTSIAYGLGIFAVFLVLTSIGFSLMENLFPHIESNGLFKILYWLFNVNKEKNIPTGFSTLLLFFSALLLAVITLLKRQTGSRTLHWAILSFGFLFMAVDEAWSFHEMLIKPVRGLLGYDNLGVFYYAWVIPGIAVVLVITLIFYRFLLRLPEKTRLAFLRAGSLYILGCIGFELIGGFIYELHGQNNLTYLLLVHVEESLEMAGVILFIEALMFYIGDNYKEVRIQF